MDSMSNGQYVYPLLCMQSFTRRVRHLEEQHYFVLQPPSAFGVEGEELACSCADQLPNCLQRLLTLVQRPGEGEGQVEKAGAGAGAGAGVVEADASERMEGEAGKSASVSTPHSVESVEALVERFEDRLDELEAWLHAISKGPTAGAGAGMGPGAGKGGDNVAGAGRQGRQQWQRTEVSALLSAAEQLRGAGEKLLGRCHVAMLRLDGCSLAAARTLLLCAADPCGAEAVEASLKLAALAVRLREGQEKVLGPDHHDLISTLEVRHQLRHTYCFFSRMGECGNGLIMASQNYQCLANSITLLVSLALLASHHLPPALLLPSPLPPTLSLPWSERAPGAGIPSQQRPQAPLRRLPSVGLVPQGEHGRGTSKEALQAAAGGVQQHVGGMAVSPNLSCNVETQMRC